MPETASAGSARHARLIIDDSRTIVAPRRMLQQSGFDVLEAGDAEAGLAIARSGPLHLVYRDIVLPGMNGFEALRQLRRDVYTRTLPVIMISGNELATEQFHAQRIGADDFMKRALLALGGVPPHRTTARRRSPAASHGRRRPLTLARMQSTRYRRP